MPMNANREDVRREGRMNPGNMSMYVPTIFKFCIMADVTPNVMWLVDGIFRFLVIVVNSIAAMGFVNRRRERIVIIARRTAALQLPQMLLLMQTTTSRLVVAVGIGLMIRPPPRMFAVYPGQGAVLGGYYRCKLRRAVMQIKFHLIEKRLLDMFA